MKEELIQLAKEKRFISGIIGKSVESKHSTKDFYYLWMCELQKWLREEHNWHIIIFTDDGDLEYDNVRYYFEVRYIIPSFKEEDKDSLVSEEGYKTYELALEVALLEALQLIK